MDTSKMKRIETIPKRRKELQELVEEAKRFLQSHAWCRTIKQGYVSHYWPGIMALFYFEIEPTPDSSADEAVWVIVGDVPPAYMDIQTCRTPAEAIEGYVGALWEWVERVKQGDPIPGDVIPVYYRDSEREVPPTLEFADLLAKRLTFIEERLLPELEE